MFLAPVAFVLERKRAPHLSYKIAFKLFLHALYGISSAVIIFNIGLDYTSATSSSAICNLVPVTTFIFAAILRMESLKLKRLHGVLKACGIVLCIAGVVILAFYKGPVLSSINHHRLLHNTNNTSIRAKSSKMRWIIGIFLTTLSIFQWSLWTILMVPILEEYRSNILNTTLQCIFATIQSFFMALALERDFSRWKLGADMGLLSVLYYGIAISAVSYYLQAWTIQIKGPVFLAMSMPLTLIFTIMLSSTILGEAITLGSVIGGVLLVGGLYNVLWGKKIEESAQNGTLMEKNHDKEANLEDKKVELKNQNDHT